MENSQNSKGNELKTDKHIFIGSLVVLAVFTVPILLWPVESQEILNPMKIWIEDNFRSMYQLLAIAVILFVGWVAFGKYSKIKLGNNEYNFSTFSWASMLFCAGVATGILYWGTIEWAYYVDAPPFGLEAGSKEAIEFGATYGMFHWGIVGWAFYCLPAVAISYSYYVKKVPILRLSFACKRVLGKHTDGIIGKTLDVLFMVGLLGSTGTSMGLGIPMISAGIQSILGIPDSFGLKILVILFCCCIFSISVYMGLGKGIKRLSNLNTISAFLFLSLFFIIGPTAFILKMTMNSMGIMAQEFIRMLTWTDPLSNSRFVEDWTIFYWAWWVAVGPFMGIFITKISGGRTIRQLVVGTILFGSLGSAVFYGILGNYALHLELSGDLAVLEMVRANLPAEAIVAVVSSLLPGKGLLIFFCLMSTVFMATSFDSTSYTLASCATDKIGSQTGSCSMATLILGIYADYSTYYSYVYWWLGIVETCRIDICATPDTCLYHYGNSPILKFNGRYMIGICCKV